MAEAPGQRAWVIPLMGVAAGVGLSFLTVAIDRHYPSGLLPGSPISNAADAQYILTTIAESVVPLTTTVLTVTLVAVQLAMGQFSPRIVRALLDDRSDQVAIAVFAATFAFALLSLRAVDTGRGTSVPAVTVLTALALAIASGVALFFFISHAGYRLRVAGLVDLVGDELGKELAKGYPAPVPPPGRSDPSVVAADHSGNVIYIDEQALVATAHRADCVLVLVPMMGDFVIAGHRCSASTEIRRGSTASGPGDWSDWGTSGRTAMIQRTDSASWSKWPSVRSGRRKTMPRRPCRRHSTASCGCSAKPSGVICTAGTTSTPRSSPTSRGSARAPTSHPTASSPPAGTRPAGAKLPIRGV
ncbi:MAG TPA: DUF2254 family protein [Streptosporangiaceae bacterium]|jgi:hypothetical protein